MEQAVRIMLSRAGYGPAESAAISRDAEAAREASHQRWLVWEAEFERRMSALAPVPPPPPRREVKTHDRGRISRRQGAAMSLDAGFDPSLHGMHLVEYDKADWEAAITEACKATATYDAAMDARRASIRAAMAGDGWEPEPPMSECYGLTFFFPPSVRRRVEST